jgi:hypothetical protein
MPTSSYVAVALWLFGLMIFAGRSLNFLRLVLNNLKPGESYFGSAHLSPLGFRFGMSASAIEPEKLNETGLRYQKKAVLNDRLMFAVGLIGFVLAASYGWDAQDPAPESLPRSSPPFSSPPTKATAVPQIAKEPTKTTASPEIARNSSAAGGRAKYLIGGAFGIWLAGLLVLATRSRNQIRLALENRHPEATRSEFMRLGFRKLAVNIDPARLTEARRIHLERAVRSERLLLLWMLDGPLFILLPAAGLLS